MADPDLAPTTNSRPRSANVAEPGLLGRRLTLTIGRVAHGGHCVARVDDEPSGRVVFVRHALPGEVVVAVVTEDTGGSYCRADAVEVITPSADRVAPPCPHAGPGRCGGCDWQHVDVDAQRRLKAAVVQEQFQRLARLDVEVEVEALPGGALGWRTRTVFAVNPANRLGLRRHRSSEIEELDACPLGAPGIGDGDHFGRPWPDVSAVELVVADTARTVLTHTRPRSRRGRPEPDVITRVEGPARLRHTVSGVPFRVSAGGFWQGHPAAAQVLADALLEGIALRPGEAVLDLYAGAGLFTVLLADAVGATGNVLGIESDRQAVSDAALNLAARPWARIERARLDRAALERLTFRPDVIVLDPPRAGVGAALMTALADRGARAIGYVSCDPASLARDVAAAVEAGFALRQLRAFDAFPMTHHIECVAVLSPG